MPHTKKNNTPQHWDILNEQLHASCKIFDVYKRHCRHPKNGKEGDFFTIKSPDWAMAIALTPKNELVMVRQFRFSTQELSWENPGGVIDANESPSQAAVRELLEETGYSGHNPKLIGTCHPNPAILNNTAHFVFIEECTQIQKTNWDHHEELQIQLFPLQNVYTMAENGIIKHAVVLNSLYFLKNYLEKH